MTWRQLLEAIPARLDVREAARWNRQAMLACRANRESTHGLAAAVDRYDRAAARAALQRLAEEEV